MTEHKADKLLSYSLFLFAGSCILSITLAEAALALMLAAILWKAFTAPEGFRQPLSELHANPLVFPLAVYLIAYMFSSIFSLDPARSWGRLDTEVIKALSGLLVFSAVARSGREKAALWFIAGASAAGLLGIYQFTSSLPRAYGTMHAVTYAQVIGLALLLAGALLPGAAGKKRTWLLSAFFVLAMAFGCSLSRGPLLGLLFSLAVLFLFQKGARRFLVYGLAVIMVYFGSSAMFNMNERNKVAAVSSYVAGGQMNESKDYASSVRLTMWKAGAAMFRDYPLTGTGPYALRKVFAYYHKRPVDEKIDFPDVHNLYLQRAADTGLPGLLALLLLFGAVLKASAVSFFRDRDVYGLWGLAAFSGFMLMMATDSSFDLPRVTFCVYLLAAMAAVPKKQNPSA
jgi:O-antigen ligase